MTGSQPIRPAATVVLARDGSEGMEVLLMQRTHRAVFMPGVFVFPGGAVDPGDAADVADFVVGPDDRAASRMLGLKRGGLDYLVAAIRECFEEAGLLLACCGQGDELLEIRQSPDVESFAALRRQLAGGELTLAELCRTWQLRLRLDRLTYISRWVTPPGPPRRFDTRFFVAVAPPGQTALHDGDETVDHIWLAPGEALERHRRGDLPLAFPTRSTLELLQRFRSTDDLIGHAWGRSTLPVQPRSVSLGGGDEPIRPGVPVRLTPAVRRLTAPNAGYMTGPGTNTYLIGEREVTVIDPGPASETHVRRILEESGGRVRRVLVTHTHGDHSPAARLLREAAGAELLGMPAPSHDGQDQTFTPDRVLRHGDRLSVDGGTLRVIHTPGHASNHLCYLLEDAGLLFAGDHVMQGSTVVINPPDGDMSAYLDSVEALTREPITHIAPGHGHVMSEPVEVLNRLYAHRLGREAKVLKAVSALENGTLEDLLAVVYEDVPAPLRRVASRSLLAHLIKLEREQRVRRSGERWRVATGKDSARRKRPSP